MTNELDIIKRALNIGMRKTDAWDAALAAVERVEAERQQLRAGIAWAYQAIGAQWPNEEALDNLSALTRGEDPPHEWPAIPPAERQRESDRLREELKSAVIAYRNAVDERDKLGSDLAQLRAERQGDTRTDGAALIAAERERQMSVEGWTPEHDNTHELSQLTRAAITYVALAARQACDPVARVESYPASWPWKYRCWKPSDDPIRNLVKAGALIAAEIDRLRRRNAAIESTKESANG